MLIRNQILSEEDPFMSAAIQNSCKCLLERAYSDLRLTYNGIIPPLQEVLIQPSPIEYILQQLEILAIRYKRQFVSPDGDRKLNIDTSFFNQMYQEEVTTVASELCQNDLHHFQGLTMHSMLASESDKALTSLNVRWNDLSYNVQESVQVNDVEVKLMKLAKVPMPHGLFRYPTFANSDS